MKCKVFPVLLAGFLLLQGALFSASAREIKVGALLGITGGVASSAQKSQAAVEQAVSDINAYFVSIGADAKVTLITEDDKSDPKVAPGKLQGLAEKGAKIVVGPMTSGSIQACKDFADKNGIILISQSSTAPDLAIQNDNVFRLVPDDNHQAEVVARLMQKDEISFIIPIWRNDLWGDNLSKATKQWFKELGGEAATDVKYDPTTQDFSAQLKTLNSMVEDALKRYGDSGVAVYLISMNEAATIFVQAQKYPTLAKVKWYGSDGTAMDNLLVSNSEAADFAQKTRFICPYYSGATTEARFRVDEAIRKKTNIEPDDYAFIAYDALWIAALSSAMVGNAEDAAALKKALTQTANTFYGVTGWTALNAAGDRDFGNYCFWAVDKKDGSFKWDRAAKFIADPALEGIIVYLK